MYAQETSPPRVSRSVTPAFPEGTSETTSQVVVAVTVGESGEVTAAEILASGGEAFDRAALEAAWKLRFEPARRGDRAVAARIPFTFDFVRPETPAPEPVATPAAAPAEVAPPPALEAPRPAEEPEELSVRGERPPREATVHTMSGDAIHRAPGTNGDLLRSVENLPGVARPSGLDGKLLVRGSGPRDTGAFLDGTWFINAYHFGGITTVVPSELIERLDFHPGNFSPEYGRLTGGVIELEMRSPRKDRLGGLLQVDLLDGRMMVEGPLGKKTRFVVAGRRSWVDAWLPGVMGDEMVVAPVYYDYQAMVEHDVSRSVTARLSVFGSDDRMKLLLSSPQASDPSFGGTFGSSESFYRIAGRVDARLSDDVRWVNKLSWGQNQETFEINKYGADVQFDVGSLRSDLRTRLSNAVSLVTGLDLLWGRYDIGLALPPITDDGQTTGPLFARPMSHVRGTGSISRPAAYAILEVRPVRPLLLTPGVRVDYMSDTENVTVDPRIASRFDVVRGPRRTTLKGAYGIFRQAPDPGQSVEPFGTRGVHSPWAEHASLGVEQSFDGLFELSMEGFSKRFHDLIVARTDETGAETGLRNVNTGSGRAYGVEWLGKWTAPGRLSGFVSYTLSRSERRNADSERYRPYQYDQTHILTATGTYDLGRGWSLGSRFRYVTGSPYTPYVGSAVDLDAGAYAPIESTQPYSARSSAFHRVDVRVDKRWQIGSVRLTAYLDVQNVYNHRSQEGRTYSHDYRRSEPLLGLPILPILGLRGEL